MLELPTPEEVRGEHWQGDARMPRVVKWELVDIWLERLGNNGDLTKLAKRLKISVTALHLRRKKLKLPPMRAGRPTQYKLTERETAYIKQREAGMTLKAIAESDGKVSPQSVSRAINHAAQKVALQQRGPTYCDFCEGSGVEACVSCNGQGPHSHMCSHCEGKSSYRMPR